VRYRYRETIYHITVRQKCDNSGTIVTIDGVEQSGRTISLVDDRQEHAVEVSGSKGTLRRIAIGLLYWQARQMPRSTGCLELVIQQ